MEGGNSARTAHRPVRYTDARHVQYGPTEPVSKTLIVCLGRGGRVRMG